MSDDLVKLARAWDENGPPQPPFFATGKLIEVMADRIEELEAKLAEYKHVSSAIDTQWAESQDQIAELEAKLAVAVDALDEAVYLLAPTERDMEREAGVYRVVVAFEELKDQE